MVPQYQPLSLGPEGGSELFAFRFREYHTAEVLVDSLRVAIEVGYVLVDHFEGTAEGTPGLACYAVTVTIKRSVSTNPSSSGNFIEALK